MGSQPIKVRTDRLSLQPLVRQDVQVLHRIYQTEGVLRYFPNPKPPELERVEQFIINQQAHWEEHGYGNWGIQPNGEQEIIGWAGLQFLPELNETEVGFLLDRPFWGLGYATEAALACLHFGFVNTSLPYIIALVHPENLASIRVIEKCGMGYQDCFSLWGIELRRYRIDPSDFYTST
jgi:RimJ/RimL family protein N-acetyltransferase